MENSPFVKEFLELTKQTIHYGKEYLLEPLLPKGFEKDEFGNYFIKIGNPKIAFTCHLDSFCEEVDDVYVIYDQAMIKSDGRTILGADDKSGMLILNKMVEAKIEGLYCYFIGLELGGLGSDWAAQNTPERFAGIESAIAFDRPKYNSVVTHMMNHRVCSDEFAQNIAHRLNTHDFKFKLDESGYFTDVYNLRELIPNCTNISVGYFEPKSMGEYQDIEFLEKLCFTVIEVFGDKK